MKEQVVVFGKRARMVGIQVQSEPFASPVRLVLVNSGVVHRVGANRMTVLLARALAKDAIDSFRFDMSGIGESSAREDNLGWEASAPLEIAEAIDVIADDDAATVLYGNCGGAAKSLWAAQLDPRVRGLLLTNPPMHPSEEEGVDEKVARRLADQICADIIRLLDRGVLMLFVYADGDSGLHYFDRRLRASLTPYLEAGLLSIEIVENSNHTFAPAPARQAVIALARRWLSDRFGPQP